MVPAWDGTMHAVWDEQNEMDAGTPHTYEIHYSQSPGGSGGRQWSNDQPAEGDKIISSLSRGQVFGPSNRYGAYYPLDAVDPSVAVDFHGFIHVVWRQLYSDGSWEIIYSRSTDNGMTWTGFTNSQDRLVSFRQGTGDLSILDAPKIVASNDVAGNHVYLHVIWTEFNAQGNMQEVFYSRSLDGGESWTGASGNFMLSSPSTVDMASAPKIAVAGPSGENVCVAWTQRMAATNQYEIWVVNSHNFGDTWSSEQPVTKLGSDGLDAGAPSIAGSDSRFILVWPQRLNTGTPPELLYGYSTTFGESWSCSSIDRRISFPDNQPVEKPSIALSPTGRAYAAWVEKDQNTWMSKEVHISRTDNMDNPTSWSGYTKDQIISTPDASATDVPADTGNVSVEFTYTDGAWRPRAVWDEENFTAYATYNDIVDDNWEIIINNAIDISAPVVSGWNLLSVPISQDYYDLSTVFNDNAGDGMTTWDRVLWYNPLATTDHWKQYDVNWDGSLNDFTSIDLTKGVWINITSVGDGYLTMTGYEPSSSAINLRTGWNLVGYPAKNDTAYNVGNLKTDTGATVVESFSSSATYKTQVASDAEVLKKGRAYWVCVPSDIVWTVNW